MKTKPSKPPEAVVLAAIESVVAKLAPRFTFGMYDVEDIAQEARIMGLEAIPRYDGVRPLENFLYAHIHNRLINLKRDEYRRNDPPCQVCHQSIGSRSNHEGGKYCRMYLEWKKRNDSKASLSQPLDMAHFTEQGFDDPVRDEAELRELRERIDAGLPVELRSTYLRMLAGKSVPKQKRDAVGVAIREILGGDEEYATQGD